MKFASFIFHKCSETLSFLTIIMWNQGLATVSCTFCRPHLPKVRRDPQFFTISIFTSSRYSLVHLLPTSPSKSPPNVSVFLLIFIWNRALVTVSHTFCQPHLPKVFRCWQFFRFLCKIELSLQSRANVANPIFQNSSERDGFGHSQAQIELSLQSCACFVDNFCRSRPETAETETLLRQPRKPLYPEKTQGFAPESLFKPEFTRSRPVPLPNYLMMMMMMWLTWLHLSCCICPPSW